MQAQQKLADRYEIEQVIGVGGMGEVYRALDHRPGRRVALKVLPASLVKEPEMLLRFEREARSAATLSHSNVVVLHDIVRDGDLTFVIAEYIEGKNLRTLINDGVCFSEALRIAHAVASGLAAAHQQELMHRDIKPENIIVSNEGQVKILDFGLAKHSSPGRSQAMTPLQRAASESSTGRPTIAVLPLNVFSNEPGHQFFGEAVAQEIIVEISRLRWIPVIARGSSFCFREARVDAAEAFRLLGAKYLLSGMLMIHGDRVARGFAGLSFTDFQNAFLHHGEEDARMHRDNARRNAERCAELDPLDPFSHLTLASASWLKDDLDGTAAWLDEAIRLNPSYAFARYNRGLIHVMCGVGEPAEADTRRAIRLSPIDPLSYAMKCTCAMSLMIRGQYGEALAPVEEAIRQPTAHIHIFAIAAVAHELAGSRARAVELTRLVQDMDSTYSQRRFFTSFTFRDSEVRRQFKSAMKRLGL